MSDYKPSETTAEVLAFSQHGIWDDCELVTVQATFARSALAELNTHRAFSRNSASSRAIPVKQMLAQVENNPFIPRRFSLAQKGMHASEFVEPGDGQWEDFVDWWIDSRDAAVASAKKGLDFGIHRQDVNRILEPFMMHTAIISSVEWHNFFNLRLATDEKGNPLAYPPIFDLALAIMDAIETYGFHPRKSPGVPVPNLYSSITDVEWHLPLVGFEGDEELSVFEQVSVSAARTARVSYLTHAGTRDVSADLELFERLKTNKHWSPFEHVAHPTIDEGSGNFKGSYWRQLRYYVELGIL